jgi:hypothetical protein
MTSDELKTAATGFLPGAVVGAVVVWLAMSMTPTPIVPVTLPSDTTDRAQDEKSPEKSVEQPPSGKAKEPAQVTNTNTVEVSDQPAGRAVMVKRISLEKTSWIAVRDFKDGKIGNVLGASRKEKGTMQDVIIDLLRSTEPGQQYAVVIFTDNGDGAFSTKTDTPVLSGSEPYRVTFSATTPVAPSGR